NYGDRILHPLSRLIGHSRKQPLHNLPVSAQPAMFAAVVGTVMRGIILNHFDIACKASARVGALNQVMAEQGIAREAAVKNFVDSLNFINSLAGKNPLAIEILVNV